MNEIKMILNDAVDALTPIPGIKAVVLGGSRARGTHGLDSDIDIGIYYDSTALDLQALNVAAQKLDDMHRENIIVAPGEWGKWVNGGGWLIMNGYQVDFILRDEKRVEEVINDCREGIITSHYQTGHPHAYLSVMYMGELAISNILYDRMGDITAMKAIAEQYPPKLKNALIEFFVFEAGFSQELAENNAKKDDIYYVTAHIVRSVSALNQVLFAVNEEYCLNEKKAVGMIERFFICPAKYQTKINTIFTTASTDSHKACIMLKSLIEEVRNLLEDDYNIQPSES